MASWTLQQSSQSSGDLVSIIALNWCWYHRSFGNQATQCLLPSSFNYKETNGALTLAGRGGRHSRRASPPHPRQNLEDKVSYRYRIGDLAAASLLFQAGPLSMAPSRCGSTKLVARGDGKLARWATLPCSAKGHDVPKMANRSIEKPISPNPTFILMIIGWTLMKSDVYLSRCRIKL